MFNHWSTSSSCWQRLTSKMDWKATILVLIIRGALCRFLVEFDRRWEENDIRFHCVELCTKSCCTNSCLNNCSPQYETCDVMLPLETGGLKYPGDEKYWAVEYCTLDECACPAFDRFGKECPLSCIANCEVDEILCPGKITRDGCKEPTFCYPIQNTNEDFSCKGVCPKECKETEHICHVPDDPITGCENEPICVPNQKDKYGYDCLNQVCPITCEDDELLCKGPKNYRGCDTSDICLPRQQDNSGNLCPGSCPVECNDDEIQCKGPKDENGCPFPDDCKKKALDINGEFCPDESDSHGCPIDCPEEEVECPSNVGYLECKDERKCIPRSKDKFGNFCPDSSDCPAVCRPEQISCPTGYDENGCKRPDVCQEQERNYKNELCPVQCSNVDLCNDSEIFCPGEIEWMGCMTPAQCLARETKCKGPDKGKLCPGWCPAICPRGQVLCPSYENPCDGCPIGEFCVPAVKDVNGIFCPGLDYPFEWLSASHNCPHPCDTKHGYSFCSGYELPNGCKLQSLCLPRSKNKYGQWCPQGTDCPKYCKRDELRCDYGLNSFGCKEDPICIPLERDKDGEQCPGFCPPLCKDYQTLQPGGTFENGCSKPSYCQDVALRNSTLHCNKWNYVNCVELPNAECNIGEYYEPRIYKETLQEATNLCVSYKDCMGIARNDFGYEPRKHPIVSHDPKTYEFWWCIDGYDVV